MLENARSLCSKFDQKDSYSLWHFITQDSICGATFTRVAKQQVHRRGAAWRRLLRNTITRKVLWYTRLDTRLIAHRFCARFLFAFIHPDSSGFEGQADYEKSINYRYSLWQRINIKLDSATNERFFNIFILYYLPTISLRWGEPVMNSQRLTMELINTNRIARCLIMCHFRRLLLQLSAPDREFEIIKRETTMCSSSNPP